MELSMTRKLSLRDWQKLKGNYYNERYKIIKDHTVRSWVWRNVDKKQCGTQKPTQS